MKHDVTFFRPFPFFVGQKIRIEGTPRQGDWEVAAITASKMTLRCPVSKKEFTWDKFCFFAEERKNIDWPKED